MSSFLVEQLEQSLLFNDYLDRTNAEVERLRREERANMQKEEKQAGMSRGSRKKEKGKVQKVPLSDDGSTDMEGASLPSDSDLDDLEFCSSDEEEEEKVTELSSSSPDRELEHMEQLEKRKKRKQLADEKEMLQRKRKKLPTRGAEGWSSGEDMDDEVDDDEEGKDDAEVEDDDEDSDLDGKVTAKGQISSRAVHEPLPDLSDEVTSRKPRMAKPRSTIMTGTRFGLQSPYDIMNIGKKSQRITLAREQIARLSTDIINDPEVSLGFIKRLSVFAGTKVESPEDKTKKAKIDDAIRASAILSLCAVFVDVLPGYRIRDLTEAEAKEKVNQELARRREWEQGLVKVYRDYLELCEKVTREKTQLSRISLKAMCTLVTKATQFNYRTNLLRSLVSYLSRRSWNTGSDEANNALIDVLKSDNHGEVSLEIVRLLNRMIKEKRFNVNEKVLEMLCYLRLKDELKADKRGDMTRISRNTDAFDKSLKPKDVRKGKGQHLSKNAVKKMKEVREIEKEMKEAEAEIDEEERERHQSETLKLLFVLYFSILKAPIISNQLYIATLQGLVIFAHRINIDFFRDLLDVLRVRIRMSIAAINDEDEEQEQKEEEEIESKATNMMTALHCIVTSFELLSGQGEALNIDLSDMVSHLFGILLPICMNSDLETTTTTATTSSASALVLQSIQLCLVSPPTYSLPTERLASFLIRMLNCSLHTPAKTSLALLQSSRILLSKKDELRGLLDNSDRAKNGYFDSSNDMLDGLRPLQSGFITWQLNIIRNSCHEEIRQQCDKILSM